MEELEEGWHKVQEPHEMWHRQVAGLGRAWQWANTRGGYWNTAGSPILCRAMNNERLRLQGYPCLVDLYIRKKTTSFSSYSIVWKTL